jgi:hypothetical protein
MCFVEITNPLKLNELKGVYGAQNRSNQMKGYARIWKWVRVLEKLTNIYI